MPRDASVGWQHMPSSQPISAGTCDDGAGHTDRQRVSQRVASSVAYQTTEHMVCCLICRRRKMVWTACRKCLHEHALARAKSIAFRKACSSLSAARRVGVGSTRVAVGKKTASRPHRLSHNVACPQDSVCRRFCPAPVIEILPLLAPPVPSPQAPNSARKATPTSVDRNRGGVDMVVHQCIITVCHGRRWLGVRWAMLLSISSTRGDANLELDSIAGIAFFSPFFLQLFSSTS